MTGYARTSDITELTIARAERIANNAEGEYTAHERYCVLWRRDLSCVTCAHLWAVARETGRVWESLVRERVRQQMTAEMA